MLRMLRELRALKREELKDELEEFRVIAELSIMAGSRFVDVDWDLAKHGMTQLLEILERYKAIKKDKKTD